MGTLEQEFLSSEIVDGEAVTVTRTVPTIDIPWALRRAILGNRRAEFVDTRRWTHGAHLTRPSRSASTSPTTSPTGAW